MRKLPYALALLGVTLLVAGLAIGFADRSRLRNERMEVAHDAEAQAASFGAALDRARSVNLLLAQSPAFSTPLRTEDQQSAAELALGYLGVLYSYEVQEAGLYDEHGRQIVGIIDGAPIKDADLARPVSNADLASPNSDPSWLAPTLALLPGQVYQAPPYRSRVNGEWVVSTSTWVPHPGAMGRLVVQFELTLDSFRRYFAAGPGRHSVLIEGRSGHVVLEDGVDATPRDLSATHWSAALVHQKASAGSLSTDVGVVSYHRVSVLEEGTESVIIGDRRSGGWWTAVWSPNGAGALPMVGGVGAGAIGFGLIVLALWLFRHQHTLMRTAARRDHLTGLANRKAFEEALADALDPGVTPRDARGCVGVLLIDLDGFKQINDRLGHDRGDQVLKVIGDRLQENLWERDTAARLGGDEFAVVLTSLRDLDEVLAVATRVREAIVRPIEVDGIPRFVGASVGVSVHPDHVAPESSDAALDLLRQADAAMYQAKRGREGVRVYEAGTEAGIAALGMAANLLAVIENDQIQMAFQPEFTADGGRVLAVEALVRWTTPDGTVVAPDEFIPVAEETGLIRSLTALTFRQALDAVVSWRAVGAAVPVSLNVSPAVLSDALLPDQVQAMLEERGLPGSSLVLELTDRSVATDQNIVLPVLDRLVALGVRIRLDDFGSGCTSLTAVRLLPLDGIKVDLSLVVEQRPGETAVLSAVVDLIHGLRLPVTVEGVEDEKIWRAVRGTGCDSVQGVHLCPPMDAGDIVALFRVKSDLLGAPSLASH